jgi:hypothetical protein
LGGCFVFGLYGRFANIFWVKAVGNGHTGFLVICVVPKVKLPIARGAKLHHVIATIL